MGLKEKLHLPDLSTMMFYLCCFGSHADGGNEEPPDRRQASVDSRQSRAGQGKTWVSFCLGNSSRLFTSDTSHVLCSSSKLCDLTDFFFLPIVIIHKPDSLWVALEEFTSFLAQHRWTCRAQVLQTAARGRECSAVGGGGAGILEHTHQWVSKFLLVLPLMSKGSP